MTSKGIPHKIPGRIGATPIPGAAGYASNDAGACTVNSESSDDEILLKFSPAFLCVEKMLQGDSPDLAARKSLEKILEYFADFTGKIIAMNYKGEIGGSCVGYGSFPISFIEDEMVESEVRYVTCLGQENGAGSIHFGVLTFSTILAYVFVK